MKIPMLNLTAQNLPIEAELKEAFANILHSGRFILGPEVDQFEEKIAAMAGAKHAIGVSSGTDALLLALMTLEIGPGDEVLCPAFTFFATAGSIARLGARPVFVDSLEETFNIDPADAVKKITDRTRAIIPVHLFGLAADMSEVMALAREHDLAVIEDGAQALGAESNEGPVGGIGTFGCFSFFPSKNLGGFGDGGMLLCNDDELAEKARLLRSHGSNPKYFHRMIGGNFRLDALQAALLSVKLPYYREIVEKRRKNAFGYLEKLKPAEDEGVLSLPVEPDRFRHVWNQFTIRILGTGKREKVREKLKEAGVATAIYYPRTMDFQECFRDLGQRGNSPVAARLSEEVLSIPIGSELTEAEQERVVRLLFEATGLERLRISAGSPPV